MKRLTAVLILFTCVGPFVLPAQNNTGTKNCVPCEQLKKLELPDVTILEATSYKKDSIDGQAITVPFCRILGRISKEINFELLLPNQWNQRFLMSGGGGFVGSIQNSFGYELNAGYACVGTDAGHHASGIDASWGIVAFSFSIIFRQWAFKHFLLTIQSAGLIAPA